MILNRYERMIARRYLLPGKGEGFIFLVASISLGATRRFRLREREGRGSCGIDLEHGSLLVMSGATQRNWLHAVPPTARTVGPRINLTFRRVLRSLQERPSDHRLG